MRVRAALATTALADTDKRLTLMGGVKIEDD
jgi:hypothetical protein